MVVKVYISGISGNKEVKKRQQRVLMILDSKSIKYEVIDITEPGREADKDFMQNNSKSNGGTVSDPNPRSPLPPQVFNDEEYCGDYDQFDLANEVDTLEQFLKEAPPEDSPLDTGNSVNGDLQISEEKKQTDETTEDNHSIENSNEVTESPGSRNGIDEKENSTKEASVEKESSPDRQKSVEKEETETVDKEADESELKKTSEVDVQDDALNANGAVSSREQSAEKEPVIEQKADNPLDAFIESEKIASTE